MIGDEYVEGFESLIVVRVAVSSWRTLFLTMMYQVSKFEGKS